MAWESRGPNKYFYRSYRQDGRVKKQYLGRGPGAATAELDMALRKRRRDLDRFALADLRARVDQMNRLIDQQQSVTRDVLHAALVAAGFHRPNRQWRLRRDRPT